MKMPLQMFEALKTDFYSVASAARKVSPSAYGALTVNNAWNVLSRVEQERQYTGDLRERLEYLSGVPCSVSAIEGYRMGPWYNIGLNDSHVETALRRILAA